LLYKNSQTGAKVTSFVTFLQPLCDFE